MMHYADIVITLVDNNKKPFREYDSYKLNKGRFSKITVPFNSEYKFLIKNATNSRIALDIDIDGSNITSSRLIVNANSTEYLERFVDSHKKFKFVPINNEAVADPTNADNGNIKIKVTKELQSYNMPLMWNHIYVSQPVHVKEYDSYNWTTLNASFTDYSTNIGCTTHNLNYGDAGATVEGSNSNQVFSYTAWNGDGESFDFNFKLVGSSVKEQDPEYLKYLELKKKFG